MGLMGPNPDTKSSKWYQKMIQKNDTNCASACAIPRSLHGSWGASCHLLPWTSLRRCLQNLHQGESVKPWSVLSQKPTSTGSWDCSTWKSERSWMILDDLGPFNMSKHVQTFEAAIGFLSLFGCWATGQWPNADQRDLSEMRRERCKTL